MRIEPLAGDFAVEVCGAQLWKPLDDAQRNTLQQVFSEHPLVVFRRQALNSADLVRFCGYLGEPQCYVERSWWTSNPEVALVSNMRNGAGEAIGGLSSRELNWHMDQSYNAEPVTGCFLYAQVLPDSGSQTSWASLYGGWDELDDALRASIADATGVFSYAARTGYVIPGGAEEGAVQQSYAERVRSTPDVRHPLVHRNPVSGRQALYFDPGTTISVDGLDEQACAAVLASLLEASTRPANVYHHQWEIGDLVLWDNAVTLHRRDAFDDSECRLLKRMILKLAAGRHILPGLVA